MTAKIYRPARNAMQSGKAKSDLWLLEYEPELRQTADPLMGWTSSADMKQQVRLRFDSKEEAVVYCEKHAIPYRVMPEKNMARQTIAYSDNFAFNRRTPWTH